MPLKLVQLPSTPYWQIHGTLRGIRVRESTGVIERKAAEEILVKRAAEIQHRSIHGDSVSVTFAEAALDYIEGGGERDHLNPIIREIGRQMVDRIGQHEIDEMAKTLGRGKSPSTLNRQVYTPTVAVLHHAARKKWCAKPVVAPAEGADRPRALDHGGRGRAADCGRGRAPAPARGVPALYRLPAVRGALPSVGRRGPEPRACFDLWAHG